MRFFGTDGVFLKRAGGRGEGPGEFPGHCLLVPSADVDSLFAYGSGRLSVFDDRGRFIRSANLLWPTVVGIADGVAGVRAGVMHIPPVGDLSFPPEPVDYGMLELESGRVVWEEDGFHGKRNLHLRGGGLV